MDVKAKNEATRRLELTFDLFEAGCDMMARKLKRENPKATEAALARLLGRWLRTRPGAELGDAAGVPSSRFTSPGPMS